MHPEETDQKEALDLTQINALAQGVTLFIVSLWLLKVNKKMGIIIDNQKFINEHITLVRSEALTVREVVRLAAEKPAT